MPNFDSFYKHHANKILKWLPMDTEKLYFENLSKRYNELKSNNWIDNHFTYKFNSYGFRCEEFSHDPSAMFLGCSNTIGIGLPVENIWPELVAKEINLKCVNLGIGGGSCDTAFRMCLGYIDKIKPKIVVFMIPPGIRYEMVFDTSVNNIIAAYHDDDFTKKWSIDDNNNYFNQQKNILAIQMLCNDRKIKFISIDSQELNLTNSLARDLVHSGIESHFHFSKKLISII